MNQLQPKAVRDTSMTRIQLFSKNRTESSIRAYKTTWVRVRVGETAIGFSFNTGRTKLRTPYEADRKRQAHVKATSRRPGRRQRK